MKKSQNTKILIKDSFKERLIRQVGYIAVNNPENAIRFKAAILKKIKSLDSMPFKHRKSIYFDDNAIRDLIFKGYIIVFRICSNHIEVFGFTKYQEKPLDD